MSAFYNENELATARWLRELVEIGAVAPGVVDERCVTEISSADVRSHTRAHFFAGIGGWDLALQLAGWPEDRPVWTASLPCQPFSQAGLQRGENDERHLWPVFRELVDECRPPIIFGEQVASRAGREWLRGNEDLQRMLDAEAIERILRLHGDRITEADLQRVLQSGGKGEEIQCPACGADQGISVLAAQEEGERAAECGPASSENQRAGMHGDCRVSSAGHRRGRVPTDRDTFQPGRREDVGQSVSGSKEQFRRVHAGEYQGSPLLRQRDGERLGAGKDTGYCRCDTCGEVFPVPRTARQVNSILEAEIARQGFASVQTDMEALGYAVGAADLCAAGIGAPHIRQRLFWLAYADRQRPGEAGRASERCGSCGCGASHGSGHDERARSQGHLESPRRPTEGQYLGRTGADDGLADVEYPFGRRIGEHREDGCDGQNGRREEAHGESGACREICRLGHAECDEPRRDPGASAGTEKEPRLWSVGDGAQSSGSIGNPWSGVVYIRCLDDKYRPIPRMEIESLILAEFLDGIPDDLDDVRAAVRYAGLLQPLAEKIPGRIQILRGAGNAIVPQVAAEFIAAAMDVLGISSETETGAIDA